MKLFILDDYVTTGNLNGQIIIVGGKPGNAFQKFTYPVQHQLIVGFVDPGGLQQAVKCTYKVLVRLLVVLHLRTIHWTDHRVR